MFAVAAWAMQAAAQPVVAGMSLPAAMGAAGSVCEQATKTGKPEIPPGAQLYMNMYREVGGIKPFEQVPALVKRFAATQPAGRAGGVSGYVSWPKAAGGSVWVVMYQTIGCDIMVTGSSDPAAAVLPFVQLLEGHGYSLIRSTEASSVQPLSQRLLLKRQPTAASPAYGTRVRVTWPKEASSKPDGIQIEISYLAGNIAVSSAPASTLSQGQ